MTRKKTIYLLAALCAVALACMLAALLAGGRETFTPPSFDPAAQQGTPTVPDNAGYSQLDAQAFRVSAAGALWVAEDNTVALWLTNPADNTVWLKARLLDKNGVVLGETGLLRQGEYVRAVTLTAPPTETAPVSIKLMAYEPETYYSAGSVALETVLNVE